MACSMRGINEKFVHLNLEDEGRYYLEDIGIDEMIIVNASSINGE